MEYMLTEDWEYVSEIVLFGAGRIMRNNLKALKKFFTVKFILDSDCEKWGTCYLGIPIQSLREAAEEIKHKKIVIMTTERTAKEIGEVLNHHGLTENRDYCSFERFIGEWFWRYQNKIVLLEVHMAVTARCTLKCKHCNMFIPHYKNSVDYSFEELKRDIDLFFKHVDYVFTYQFLGGEPLLNPELEKILAYIGEHYAGRIGSIGIITNGTILPNERLRQISGKYNIVYHISDYSNSVHYKDRLDQVVSRLEESHVESRLNRSLSWLDFGFPERPRHFETGSIRTHMLACGPVFHGLNDGKLFYCHVAWSADKAGLFPLSPADYIDLKELSGENRSLILDHCRGSISGGYVGLCAVCGGCGADNLNYVPTGVQMSREES